MIHLSRWRSWMRLRLLWARSWRSCRRFFQSRVLGALVSFALAPVCFWLSFFLQLLFRLQPLSETVYNEAMAMSEECEVTVTRTHFPLCLGMHHGEDNDAHCSWHTMFSVRCCLAHRCAMLGQRGASLVQIWQSVELILTVLYCTIVVVVVVSSFFFSSSSSSSSSSSFFFYLLLLPSSSS